jgi:hypothetical protein
MKGTEEKRLSRYRIPIMAGFFSLGALMFIGMASASPYQDIPEGVNDALFGGSNLYAAKMILAGGVLASIGLAMSISKVNFMATVIVMLTTATVLVAIGWLDFWIIILVALLIVSMFGKAMISWVSGETSGG